MRICPVTISNKGFMNLYSAMAFSGVMYWAAANKIPCREFLCYDQHPISKARQLAVEEFLKDKNNSHLLFLDDDTIPPIDLIPRLLNHKKLVVSGWYLFRRNKQPSLFKREGEGWVIYDVETMNKSKTDLISVDGIGMGCCLIDRKVFEVIKPPYYLEMDGVGEDLYFSKKVKEYGMEIFVDKTVRCGHHHWVIL